MLFANFLALFGFLVAAPAGEWTLKNHDNSLVFVGESVCAPFCAPLKNKNAVTKFKRKPCRKRKTNTRAATKRTPKLSKSSFWEAKIDPGGLAAAAGAPRSTQEQQTTTQKSPRAAQERPKNAGKRFSRFSRSLGGPDYEPPGGRWPSILAESCAVFLRN